MSGQLRRRGALVPLGMTVILALAGCGPANTLSVPLMHTLADEAAGPIAAPEPATEAPPVTAEAATDPRLEAPVPAEPAAEEEAEAPAEPEQDEIVRSLGLIASQTRDADFQRGISEVIVTLSKADKARTANRPAQALGHLRMAKYQFQGLDVSALPDDALKAIPLIDQAIDQRIIEWEANR